MVRNKFSERVPVRVSCVGSVTHTKQSMRDECDINNILKKFKRTGAIAHAAKHAGSYMDVSPLEFHEAMNIVAKATEMFADLPSRLRQRFSNNPASFLEYVQDEKNLPEMMELGLAAKRGSVAPLLVEIAPASSTAPPATPAEPPSSS